MSWTLKLILVTLLSAATLLGIWFGTAFNMIVAFVCACTVAGLGLWAIPRKREASEILLAEGVTQADLDSTVSTCRRAGLQFRELAALIPKADIHDMVVEIGDTCVHIADNFIHDPGDLRQARDFIHHLGRAVQLIEGYVQQAGQQNLTAEEAQVLLQTEDRIAHIREAFHTHLRNFRADNIRQLAIGGKALGDILRMEAPSTPTIRRS